jgi:dTDP-glucose 4,6-dehydratase
MQQRILLVTGGLGFIGKHFVAHCLDAGHCVINVDMINYAADRVIKHEFELQKNYKFIHSQVEELPFLPECDVVVNFAAESHVDNSIADNLKFCHSNVLGAHRLLELVRAKQMGERPLFVQISTDEVYGDIVNGRHKETDNLRPSNPYSSTKAAADMLVIGWSRTYSIDYRIIRMSNNYGPHQFPEKLIPKSCMRMSRGLPALMHGDGSYIRSWLHARDAARAVMTVIDKGKPCSIYNVSGDTELPNIEVLKRIAQILNVSQADAFVSVPNRVGQDIRYSMDDGAIRALGWSPEIDFDAGLQEAVHAFDRARFIMP